MSTTGDEQELIPKPLAPAPLHDIFAGKDPTTPTTRHSVAVIHLVREPNGIETFRSFLESYRRHDAGMPHELVLLFKGFPETRGRTPPEYAEVLGDIAHRALFVPDAGFDIASYVQGARACDHEFVLFLNSFSTILDDDWLAKFYRHATVKGVGVVGATGSLESPVQNTLINRPPRVPPERRQFLGRILDPLQIRRRVSRWRRLRFTKRHWPPFPNPHLRTNAFMIRRELFLALRVGPLNTKDEAVMFECGWFGMTRQIFEMGLEALVVGRDGRGYPRDSWYDSHTFRSGEQRNLLIADNRTRYYEQADSNWRRGALLSTWGA